MLAPGMGGCIKAGSKGARERGGKGAGKQGVGNREQGVENGGRGLEQGAGGAQKKGGTNGLAVRAGRPVTQTTSGLENLLHNRNKYTIA